MKNVHGDDYMERERRMALVEILKKVNDRVLRPQPFPIPD